MRYGGVNGIGPAPIYNSPTTIINTTTPTTTVNTTTPTPTALTTTVNTTTPTATINTTTTRQTEIPPPMELNISLPPRLRTPSTSLTIPYHHPPHPPSSFPARCRNYSNRDSGGLPRHAYSNDPRKSQSLWRF